jgi:mannosyltransferase
VLAAAVTFAAAWAGIGRRALWLDEAYSRFATEQLRETLEATAATMGLYYVVLDPWAATFGDSAVALRTLSALCMAAMVPAAWWTARRSLRNWEPVSAVVAMVALPVVSRYGQEARSYALTTLVVALSWIALAKAVSDPHEHRGHHTRQWWLGFALLSSAGVLSHGLYVVQIAAQGASLLVHPSWRSLARRFLASAAFPALTFVSLAVAGHDKVADWIPALHPGQVTDLAATMFGPVGLLLVPLTLLVGHGAVVLGRRAILDPARPWPTVVPVAWGVGPPLALIVISVVRPTLIGRYLVPSAPAVAMLLAVGTLDLAQRAGRRTGPRARRLTVVSASALVVLALVAGQIATRHDTGYGWREAATWMAQEAGPDDGLIVPQSYFALPLALAWREVSPAPGFQPDAAYPQAGLDRMRRYMAVDWPDDVSAFGDRTLWVVHRTEVPVGDHMLNLALDLLEPTYRVVEHRHFDGGVQVVRMVPR